MRFNHIFLLLMVLVLCGCGIGKSLMSGETNPMTSVNEYYKFMQWKSYQRAAEFVYPEELPGFDKAVSKVKDDLHITDYEVKELVPLDESDPQQPATVRVVISYYRYPSISEKKTEVKDTWIKYGKSWLVKPDFDSEIFKY